MRTRRRSFLKQVAGVASVALGGTQLSGCLGGASKQETTAALPNQSGAAGSDSAATTIAPAAQSAPTAPSTGSTPTATPANAGPVWTTAPTIAFVEGVPKVVSVGDFVKDPESDPLTIALRSGTFLPGITWNPTNATIGYDGRPLGAKPGAPVVVTNITFSADDHR